MANQYEYTRIGDIIDEYIEDLGLNQEEVNYPAYVRWATDCMQWLHVPDQLSPKMLLTHTEKGRVLLPEDFASLQQIAYRKIPPKEDCPRTTKYQMVEWVQHDYESGLDVTVRVNCPKCGSNCKCKHNPISACFQAAAGIGERGLSQGDDQTLVLIRRGA